uniref:Uncharacterized protein n=1 Tax=Magallana gigas TaxID=29159 RepID=K1R888_MAGGI
MSGRRGPNVNLTDSNRTRRKKERNAAVGKSRISIENQIDRWNEVKSKLACETNAEVVRLLLDWLVRRKQNAQYYNGQEKLLSIFGFALLQQKQKIICMVQKDIS